ncbi:hypothetical protein ACIBG8_34625 [Nonomuraea sp. NPDC050556]|uniref:VMAP-C domain-containing protein n=1 Tax=Nonomuraea sp. NPDC050556 TaxID=3364369 RepID=UPI0037A7E5E7
MPEFVHASEIAEVLATASQLKPEDLLNAINSLLSPNSLNIAYSPLPNAHFLNIVQGCMALENGRAVLLRAVEFHGKGTTWQRHVIERLSVAEPLLAAEEAKRIEELLSQCEIAELATIYSIVTDGKHGLFPSGLTNAGQVFGTLIDYNSQPGRLGPHLAFAGAVYRLLLHRPANSHDLKVVEELRHWLYNQRDLLRGYDDVAANELELLIRQAPPFEFRTDLPVCLVIRIEQLPATAESGDSHLVSHWTHTDPMSWRPVRGKDVELSFDQIAAYVVGLALETEGEWTPARGGPLLLEFMLSPELVNLAVDEWPRRVSAHLPARPLGADYEVMLRTDERLRPRARIRQLHVRAERLSRGQGEVHVVPGEPVDLAAVHETLLHGENLVACVLSAPPDTVEGLAQLTAALDAGLPIVLWCRDIEANEDFRAAMGEILRAEQILSVSQNVLRLRSSRLSYRCVSLLWDDPHRTIPDSPRLRSYS